MPINKNVILRSNSSRATILIQSCDSNPLLAASDLCENSDVKHDVPGSLRCSTTLFECTTTASTLATVAA
jgi:hypothetical protein